MAVGLHNGHRTRLDIPICEYSQCIYERRYAKNFSVGELPRATSPRACARSCGPQGRRTSFSPASRLGRHPASAATRAAHSRGLHRARRTRSYPVAQVVAMAAPRTVRAKLLKWPQGVALILPEQAARACSFRTGAYVRVIVLPNEVRIRLNSVPCVDDQETYEAYLEREAAGESCLRSRLNSSLA